MRGSRAAGALCRVFFRGVSHGSGSKAPRGRSLRVILVEQKVPVLRRLPSAVTGLAEHVVKVGFGHYFHLVVIEIEPLTLRVDYSHVVPWREAVVGGCGVGEGALKGVGGR